MNLQLLLLPALFASVSLDNSSDAAFHRGVRERANAAEARPAFAEAAKGYREYWHHKHQRGIALAWGRASYLAGDLPSAIAAFRSGLHYYPADAELLAGLRFCRAEATSLGAASVPPEGLRQRFTPGQRLAFAVLAMTFFAFGLLCQFTVRWRSSVAWMFIGILGLVTTAVLEWQCQREIAVDLAQPPCVVRFDTPLRTGNGESYAPLLPALLPRGTEARELARRGGWVQVQLESGEIGWLPEEMLVMQI